MVSEKRYREEILKTIYFIQTQLEKSAQMGWEVIHERLSQTAIKETMWQRTEGGKGLRNNELIVQTFKDLRAAGLVTVKAGKQKAKLYFLTEHGRVYAGLMTVNERKQKAELNLLTKHGRGPRDEYLKQEQPPLIGNQSTQMHPKPTNKPFQSAFNDSHFISIDQLIEFERRRKSPELAYILGAFFPGLGLIYAGNTRRGVGVFALLIFLFLVSIAGIFINIINIIVSGIFIGIWFYHIYYGYKQAKNHNEALLRSLNNV